jgi:NAD(P)-dependent dehydrogenase (short-subunit alcohol dehydrogenase family)
LRVNRAFLGAMRNRRSGLIVYISSVVGRIVLPFGGVYCASKWALEALAEAASYELRPFGVEVGIVEPGAFSTNISASRTGPDDQARVAAYGESAKAGLAVGGTLVEMAKGHAPSEVAHAVVALAKATPGTRPLRTVVDFGLTAAAEINARIAPLQSDTLLQFGVGQLAAPA